MLDVTKETERERERGRIRAFNNNDHAHYPVRIECSRYALCRRQNAMSAIGLGRMALLFLLALLQE